MNVKKSVLLLDGIGPEAEPILTEAGLQVVDAKKGFGEDLGVLLEFIRQKFQPGELRAICLRSSTKLKTTEAMVALRKVDVELIVRFGTGTDNIDLKAAAANGIIVENTPGQNATSVAEKTMLCAGLLCHRMNLPIAGNAAIRAVQAFAKRVMGFVPADERLAFDAMTQEILAGLVVGKADCKGTEFYGKTMGVIGGCGAIGMKVSTRAMSLGMKVLVFDPRKDMPEAEGATRVESLEELLRASDFVTVHVPLTDDTRDLISMEQIMIMKQDAILLNLARGGVVDVSAVDADLANADSRLGGYASDVDDSTDPVFSHPNTIVMPHIGASSQESKARCALVGASQVVSWFQDGDIVNGVNFSDSSLSDRRRNGQLTVIHQDKPGLIEHLSGYFAEHKVNIGLFHTAPQNGYACSMIGPDDPFDDKVVTDLAAMKGVIRVIPLVHQ